MANQLKSSIPQNKTLALLLALLSVISIIAMLHHPSIAASGAQQQVDEILVESSENALVHGVLIALTIMISFCLTTYAQSQGLNHSTILFGLVSYWIGTLAMIAAALMSGFVSVDLAAAYSQSDADHLAIFMGLKKLGWFINQSFASFGAICWCTAMCWWSIHLFSGTKNLKVFALLSLLVGIFILTSLILGWLSLNVTGMTIILIVISVWQLGIAGRFYFQSHLVTK